MTEQRAVFRNRRFDVYNPGGIDVFAVVQKQHRLFFHAFDQTDPHQMPASVRTFDRVIRHFIGCRVGRHRHNKRFAIAEGQDHAEVLETRLIQIRLTKVDVADIADLRFHTQLNTAAGHPCG